MFLSPQILQTSLAQRCASPPTAAPEDPPGLGLSLALTVHPGIGSFHLHWPNVSCGNYLRRTIRRQFSTSSDSTIAGDLMKSFKPEKEKSLFDIAIDAKADTKLSRVFKFNFYIIFISTTLGTISFQGVEG